MTIYIILIIELLIFGILHFCGKIEKKAYCIIVGISLAIISGFRGVNVGLNDVANVYLPSFHRIANTPWSRLFTLQNIGISNFDNTGFLILSKIIATIWTNDHFYIFVFSVPYIILSVIYIYKYSEAPTVSFSVFLALNMYISTFYLVRQCIAATFLFLALEYLNKGHKGRFILWVIIAASMHTSAIAFLVVLLFEKLELSFKTQLFIILGSLIIGNIGLVFWQNIVIMLTKFIPTASRYLYVNLGEFGQTWFIAATIIIIANIATKKIKEKDKITNLNLNLSVTACFFYGLMPLLSEFSRIALYFGMGLLVTLPNALRVIKNNYIRTLGYVLTTMVFLAYFIYLLPGKQLIPYEFLGF